MRVTAIHRWHWVVIGLTCGLVYGWVGSCSGNFADELDSYGRRIGQREFERAVETRYEGRAAFKDLVVYPYVLSGSSAGTERVYVVSGLYCDGEPREQSGRTALDWEPGYFVASSPFRPVGLRSSAKAVGASQASFDTVMTYLASKKSAGVSFRYAAWVWAAQPMVVWPVAGLVLIGLVWPTVVNLLVFGTLTRPREPKAQPAAPPPPAAKKPEPETDLEALGRLEEELEATVGETQPSVQDDSAAAPTPRAIATSAVEAVETASGPSKEFGAKQEDFYPTELGAKH